MNGAEAFDMQGQFRVCLKPEIQSEWVHCTGNKLKFFTRPRWLTISRTFCCCIVTQIRARCLTYFTVALFSWAIYKKLFHPNTLFIPLLRICTDERNIVWITTCWNVNRFVFAEWNAEKNNVIINILLVVILVVRSNPREQRTTSSSEIHNVAPKPILISESSSSGSTSYSSDVYL